MITFREGVFETNSSSTHAIIINKSNIISELLEDKHYINIATSEIVLEDKLEEDKSKMLQYINTFIDSDFRGRGKDLGMPYCNCNYGISHVSDRALDVMIDNGLLEYGEYRYRIKKDISLRREYIRLFIENAYYRFSDMNADCEIAYQRDNDIFTDTNNNTYDAISVYGSDSYDFGEWPTR